MKMKIRRNLAISDSGFIFNPATGDSFSTNPIGLEIIHHLKEDLGKDEIKKRITQKYQVDELTFEKDFFDFINTLNYLKLNDCDE